MHQEQFKLLGGNSFLSARHIRSSIFREVGIEMLIRAHIV